MRERQDYAFYIEIIDVFGGNFQIVITECIVDPAVAMKWRDSPVSSDSCVLHKGAQFELFQIIVCYWFLLRYLLLERMLQ